MKETNSAKNVVKYGKKEQSPGRWIPAGIGGAGATVGILFGNFILAPAMSSQVMGGLVLGMLMGGAGAGLVMGLSFGFRKSSE